MQKTVLMAPAPQKKKPGLRGAIAEHKKEELTGYMQQAVALVKQYLPPNPKRIQAAKEAGKVSVALLGSGQRVRVDIRDYALAGDTLGIEADLATNRLLGLKVSTYLENPKDAVSLNAQFASLPDGTTYLHQALLDATAKKVQVAVGNSDYRRKSN